VIYYVIEPAGLSRESLYKALSGDRSPSFDTILKVIAALGWSCTLRQRAADWSVLTEAGGARKTAEDSEHPRGLGGRIFAPSPLWMFWRNAGFVDVPCRGKVLILPPSSIPMLNRASRLVRLGILTFAVVACNLSPMESDPGGGLPPATLHHFAVVATDGNALPTQRAGSAFDIRILAQEREQHTVTSYTGTPTLTSTGMLSLGGGPTTAFTAGVLAPVSVTISNTGSFTITGDRRRSHGMSNAFTVSPVVISLRIEPFLGGLSNPVFLTAPLGDGRIFVVEQGGTIRVVRNGSLQSTPFLDISGRISSGGERGLLSVAFHPQYATNGFFFVYTTAANGDIRIERYRASSADVADPASAKLILTTAHSAFSNHNGGLVAFGPDGMLYLGLGDGGSGGDPFGNGQNFNALLGSLLRIDVNGGDPYAIPASNPFAGQAGKRGEIWAKGLRNPWRYAFDAPTGMLYIADVGQNAREEVNVAAIESGGLNYGWNIMEASSCYGATTCVQTGLTLPAVEYDHGNGCSITGGYVYRGSAMPWLHGYYFYSDYCSGWLHSFRYQAGVSVEQRDWGIPALPAVTSFGLDAAGELYIISGSNIFKIVQGP